MINLIILLLRNNAVIKYYSLFGTGQNNKIIKLIFSTNFDCDVLLTEVIIAEGEQVVIIRVNKPSCII